MHRFLVGEDYYYSTTTAPCFQEKNVKKGKKMLLLEIRYPCVVRSPDLDAVDTPPQGQHLPPLRWNMAALRIC